MASLRWVLYSQLGDVHQNVGVLEQRVAGGRAYFVPAINLKSFFDVFLEFFEHFL